MAVSRLALTDFRNHADLVVSPGAGLVALVGENGAGKTNILEAVSLLAPGRGLRRAALGEMARESGAGGFAVAAHLDDGVEIGTGTTAAAPERRIVRINGTACTVVALAERLSLVWLTPAMDRLFIEGASGRRRFLDRLVLALAPAHAGHAQRYEAAMRARNRLLAEEVPDQGWLDALEAAMASHGEAIGIARETLILALASGSGAPGETIFPAARVTLGGWRHCDAEMLARALRDGRSRDRAAGRTLAGPHRSDLLVEHAAKGRPAAQSSTGEQKALLLSIVLAHADLVAEAMGRRPLLLLDEVAAHLDSRRRAALFERLDAAGGQVWMTGTEAALFDGAGRSTQRIDVGPRTACQL